MDKEFIMATARTAEQQILWSINKWEYMSWGVRQKAAIEYEGMATLALRVSGAVHKGWVYVSLNEGMDCYEVRLLNVARTKVKRTLEEVYCDNLGEVLDGLIERKAEWTDAQYKDKAVRDSARKMGMDVIDVSKKPEAEPMASDGVRYRPATLDEIEGRDTDLYMQGERVWVMMICRSETIGEDSEPKLDYIWLTNGKKVQVEDLQVIDNNNNEPNKEDKTMRLNINNNESENVQSNAQVTNEPIVKQVDVIGLMNGLKKNGTARLSDYATPIEDAQAEEVESVAVGEVTVDSIMPTMQPVEGSEYQVKGDDGKDVTFESVAPAMPEVPSSKVQGSSGKFQVSGMPRLTLVVYTTSRTQEQAPRIEGFGGESDPRWKRHYDERMRLKALKADADKKNEKLRKAMKGKTKAEKEEMMKKWVVVHNDPFNAVIATDRTTGEKHYHFLMGAKYLDVARKLVEAYNSGDEQAIAAAEQAVIDTKNGIVAEKVAEREARRAERAAKKAQDVKPETCNVKPETKVYTEQEVAALMQRVLQGDAAALSQVNAMLAKAA